MLSIMGKSDSVQARLSILVLRPRVVALQVCVLCPDLDDYEALSGQLLEVEVAALTDTVGELKARLAEVLALPVNKQKLSREGVGVLRDEQSLAHYNVSPDVQLQLGIRERGGRKR